MCLLKDSVKETSSTVPKDETIETLISNAAVEQQHKSIHAAAIQEEPAAGGHLKCVKNTHTCIY